MQDHLKIAMTSHGLRSMSGDLQIPNRGDHAMVNDGDVMIITKNREKTWRPPMYNVIMHNDDFTPIEFVVHVLQRFFHIEKSKAIELMRNVHEKGAAIIGAFSHEIAETKITQVMDLAKKHEFPLRCTMEKDE